MKKKKKGEKKKRNEMLKIVDTWKMKTKDTFKKKRKRKRKGTKSDLLSFHLPRLEG